ncbi:Metal-dependent hydrolase, endonuclease/exonuclease/phosphatase family [Pedococcus cremeus]|uniref:Metal-dependent hydrolase, endonuclease/exonuclease/phosphatase family n=1 Tax=Pedococcus cremeus TaxID=587636 RepID=A0A1H9X2C3_9MICO|nr:endonuclease/exonuclease/phosphatase family protein [Pedococcus cremeus]SES40037.1 Metal-dependent hydrolase, endonuclease/exonuclease/phosphatase family [Pedococcus cremeus]
MRFATFNILNGRVPTDQHVTLDGLTESVKRLDADVLALQEVDHNQHRSENADLTAIAAEAMGAVEHRFVAALSGSHGATGATWVAATGEEHPDAAAYGIALLSRWPVHGWQVVRLPPVPLPVPMRFGGRLRPYLVRDEPRVAVVATIETPCGVVTVVNTHLSFLRWWNGRQLRRVVASLVERSGPVVLMGDLNMGPEQAVRLTGLQPAASALTFPVHEPTEQLDHILVGGGLVASGGEAMALPISDHRALTADLT